MRAIRGVVATVLGAATVLVAGGAAPSAQAADPVVTITSADFPTAPVAGKTVVVTGRVHGAPDGTEVRLDHWVSISTRAGGQAGWYQLATAPVQNGRYRIRTTLKSNRTRLRAFVRGSEVWIGSKVVTAPQPRPWRIDAKYGDKIAPRIPGQRLEAEFYGRKGQLVHANAYRDCGTTVTRQDGTVVPRVFDTFRLPAEGRYVLRKVACWGETTVAAAWLRRRDLQWIPMNGSPVSKTLASKRTTYLAFRNPGAFARIVPLRTSGWLSTAIQGPREVQQVKIDGIPVDVGGLGTWTIGPRGGLQDIPLGAGTYYLKMESWGDSSFTLQVNSPRARGATTISGSRVPLDTGQFRGRQNTFTFAGTAGTWVSLDVRGRAWRSWTKDDQVLIAPSGDQVFTPRTTESPVFQLPETGTYRVVLTPTRGLGTGSVRVLPATYAPLPVDDTPVTATVSEPYHVAVLQTEGDRTMLYGVTGSSGLASWRADVLMDLSPMSMCGGPLPGCRYWSSQITQDSPTSSEVPGRSYVVFDPVGTGTGAVEFRAR